MENKVILESMGVVLVDGKGAENDSSRLEAIERMTSANAQAIQTNATELDEESETRKNADDALSARIDNLVAPSGNSVAEITDARVGADGKTYTSLAARLNAEYGKVSNILTVGVGKMYQSIGAAINAANNGDIILIYRGIYEESILNRDKCVNLVGVSKDECILRYPSDDYPKPPLEMGMGIIENLTIHAYNNNTEATTQFGKGYCLHCDFYAHYQSNPPFSNYLYCRNVHFVNDNNEAVGIGLRPNFTIEFDSCTFETLSGDEACFYVHSSTNANTINAKCIVRNCTIVNNAANKETFRMDGYSFTNGGSTLVMQRNIVVNRGGGVKFAMHRYNYGTETGSNWQGVSDWILDKTSMMNNVDECNS